VRGAAGFAAAARRPGYADPNAVDHHLRAATTAFLARDYAAARHIFEALLRPIAAADVDLGEQELVEEVLGVSVHDCAARWVASVYVTSPPADRADTVLEALNAVDAVAPMAEPLAAMERVVLDPLPGLADFLPRWSALLQREAASGPRWHERSRLREAVMRAEGTAGLARLARTSKCPEDARAWCTAVAAEGNWAAVLRVNDEAVALVESPHDRGDFHDAAALAARELGRPDFAARLEMAWRVAPTLPRLLRWLLVHGPDPAAVAKRAETARAACPRGAGRLQGLLAVLAGDLEGAASLLARAPARARLVAGRSSRARPVAGALVGAGGRASRVAAGGDRRAAASPGGYGARGGDHRRARGAAPRHTCRRYRAARGGCPRQRPADDSVDRSRRPVRGGVGARPRRAAREAPPSLRARRPARGLLRG